MNIDIICPLYKAEKYITNLNNSIMMQQNVNINTIHYILTESKDNTEKILQENAIEYKKIKAEEFSHSLTRETEAMKSNADIIVFITQDIEIRDKLWLYKLIRPIENGECEATYSRQIAKDDGIEKYTREINYPKESKVVSKKDVDQLGLRTFFFSDASSAIRADIFKKLNGYDGKKIPINEDQYFAYKLIMNGYKIRYCADSIVYHSHNFTLKQIFKRYYDTGVFFKQNNYLDKYGTNKTGGRLAIYTLKKAIQDRNVKVILQFIPNMAARFIGMKMGKYKKNITKMSRRLTMNEDLISVIVPVYNVEKYVKKCIESIVNQTYKNLQIILIDDGSKDKSGDICDNYAKSDSRILVVHKSNGGLSDARNKGIKVAKGKYITFIDSDDYIDIDYIEYLYNLIKKYNTKISFCKYEMIYEEKLNKTHNKNEDEKLLSKVEAFEDILYAKNFEVSAWAKMYLKELFNNVEYPKGKLFEDNATTYKLIDKVENVSVGFASKYYYIKRKNSITNRTFSKEQAYLIKAVDDMCLYLDKYDELKDACNRKRYWARISTLNRMINAKERNKKSEKDLRKDIMNYKSILFDKKSSVRDKLALILLIFGIQFYKLVWNIYEKITGRR